MYPAELKYASEHEWVRVDGDRATIGISHYAQDNLGEVVFVDLPAVGDTVAAGENFGEVESVKSVSDLVSPVSGEVLKVNDALDGTPETINDDPYGAGWMIEVKLSDPREIDGLMSAEEYRTFIAGEA